MYERISYWVYEGVAAFFHIFFTLTLSMKIRGKMRVPPEGPLLIIANHQSTLDPVLIGLSMERHITFMARKSLFRNPLIAGLFYILGAVPLDRESGGKEGLKVAIELLAEGKAVAMFPEGTRTEDGNMQPFLPGIQLLIKRAQPTILPIGIAGAFESWPYWRPIPLPSPIFLSNDFAKVAVCVGQPLDGKMYAQMPRDAMLADLFSRVEAVVQEAEKLRRKK